MLAINTAAIVAAHRETVDLNWAYRRKYLLETVIAYDQMQVIEHAAPYWLIHYLSVEFGASMARLTEAEWAELREEPEFAHATDQIPRCDTSSDSEPHEAEGPSIQQQLAGTHLYVPADQQFPEPARHTREVPNDRMLDVEELQAQHELTRPRPSPEVIVLSTEALDVTMVTIIQQRREAITADIPAAAPEPHTGRSPEKEAERQARIALRRQEAADRRYLARHPPLPKLPEPVALAPLVVPSLRTVGMAGFMHHTFELQTIHGTTDASHYWLLAENSNSQQGDFTLLDALLRRQSLLVRYYKAPRRYLWATLDSDICKTDAVKLVPFQDVLATAVGFFAGRVLGVVLAYQDGHDEPTGDGIQHFLSGEPGHLDKPYHLDRILDGLDLSLKALHRDVRDRLELPVRLLRQVKAVSQIPLAGRRDERVEEFGVRSEEYLTLKQLVDYCNLTWQLNATLPAGYAFFQGLLQPKRLFFTQPEQGMLRELLKLTSKSARP